jgi:NAD(P) transhydrogenase
MQSFDVVILGGGPAGERAAIQAAKLGKRAALIEREHTVGGTGINWGAIPSKTLRESALFVASLTARRLDGIRCEIDGDISIAEFMQRERQVVQRELDLINRSLDKWAVEILNGHGRFVDPHVIGVTGVPGQMRTQVKGDVVVIAVGSHPDHPADIDFDSEVIFDSASILRLPRMPRSVIVLGAGVIGVEYASIFAAMGLHVTLVDTRSRILPYLDLEIGDLLRRELKRLGIILLQDDHYVRIEKLPGTPPAVRLHTRQGHTLEADVLLYCVGRTGNTADLGLEAIGMAPDARGLLPVNADFQTALPHVYAVGDVIGYPALASTSMEQGRQAVRHAFGAPDTKRETQVLPFAIYAIPEVSYIGDTEESAAARGIDIVVGRGSYGMNPRGQIIGDTTGLLKLIFDAASMKLSGVHVIGTNASELVHIGQAFLYSGATAEEIMETLYNYPTLSDLYRHAALEALTARRRRAADHTPDVEESPGSTS